MQFFTVALLACFSAVALGDSLSFTTAPFNPVTAAPTTVPPAPTTTVAPTTAAPATTTVDIGGGFDQTTTEDPLAGGFDQTTTADPLGGGFDQTTVDVGGGFGQTTINLGDGFGVTSADPLFLAFTFMENGQSKTVYIATKTKTNIIDEQIDTITSTLTQVPTNAPIYGIDYTTGAPSTGAESAALSSTVTLVIVVVVVVAFAVIATVFIVVRNKNQKQRRVSDVPTFLPTARPQTSQSRLVQVKSWADTVEV